MAYRRTLIATLASLVSVAALALLPVASVSAATDIQQAGAELRGGASVYNDPAAENALSPEQADALTDQIAATGLPIFVAVLPSSAGSGDDALKAVHDEVGLGGIYAVVAGDQFRAGSTNGTVSDLSTQAFREQRDAGVAAVLTRFVELSDQRFAADGSTSGSEGSGAGALVVLLVLVIGAAVVIVVVMRRARRRQRAQLAAVRQTVDADITEYGERLGRFSIDDPDMSEDARADMQRALDGYDRAKSAAMAMSSPADATTVTSALEDGRYALACVSARIAREPLPERRPPCFVDPRHGPSVDDVDWTPPGLTAREVPLCAACRTTVEAGGQPQGLMVGTGSGQLPYYQAGPEYGAYAQGYYSPFGNVMTGLLVGTMLSGMWHPTYMGGVSTAGMGGGGHDSSGGWSFGGGGGGDFGGGDFGGGDFGGGGDF